MPWLNEFQIIDEDWQILRYWKPDTCNNIACFPHWVITYRKNKMMSRIANIIKLKENHVLDSLDFLVSNLPSQFHVAYINQENCIWFLTQDIVQISIELIQAGSADIGKRMKSEGDSEILWIISASKKNMNANCYTKSGKRKGLSTPNFSPIRNDTGPILEYRFDPPKTECHNIFLLIFSNSHVLLWKGPKCQEKSPETILLVSLKTHLFSLLCKKGGGAPQPPTPFTDLPKVVWRSTTYALRNSSAHSLALALTASFISEISLSISCINWMTKSMSLARFIFSVWKFVIKKLMS